MVLVVLLLLLGLGRGGSADLAKAVVPVVERGQKQLAND